MRTVPLASIFPDLRTSLTVLRELLQAIKDQLVTDPEELATYTDKMYSQVLHLIALTSTLLEVARLNMDGESVKKEPVSVGDVLNRSIALIGPLLEEKDVKIVTEAEDIPPVYLDPEKIGRVLYNLLENAVQHSPEGGTVIISAREAEGALELSVTDEGPGIPPGDEQEIFQPFYKGDPGRASRPHSPGLGLTIVKKFVELHHGTVRAHNRAHGGAEFVIRLPLEKATET